MPESVFGEGLRLDDSLPMVWSPGPLVHGLALVRLNADNHQLLVAEASLDDVRVGEALKDESPALLHELQRLEIKLNVLLRLTAELARRNSNLPAARPVRLSAVGIEWFDEDAPTSGASGMVDLYINTLLPQPLRLPAQFVCNHRDPQLGMSAQMQFTGLSDPVVDLVEKFIFRHHRRLVASSRPTSGTR